MPTKLIKPKRFGDERGWFTETYNSRGFAVLGIDCLFVQDNHAYSAAPFVLRGLHFQAPPHAQSKLIRCVRGRIWDVVVDIRAASPTHGRWVGAELTATNGWQMFAPSGFAHGYLTLEADTEVQYKVDDYYAPAAEGGLAWDDPSLALPWPLDGAAPVLAPRDRLWPRLGAFVSPFQYDGVPMTPLDQAEA